MKSTWWPSAIIILSMTLAACSSETADINEESASTPPSAESETKEVETAPMEDTEAVEEEAAAEETKEGLNEDIQEDESLKATNTFTNKDLKIEGEIGPVKYEIPAIQLKILEPKDQATADLFEVKIGEEVHAFTIQVIGENTADEDVSFYLGQAIAITNTKEQLETDMFLSEGIQGDYLGKVRHEGSNVYILKNSTVDELKTIELRITAPTDNVNYEPLGEDASVTIEVNN